MLLSLPVELPHRVTAVCLTIAALSFFSHAPRARGDVVVLANRSPQEVAARVVIGEQQRPLKIASGRQVVLRVAEPCQLWYDVSGNLVRYQLDNNAVYFFAHNTQGWLDLNRVDLGEPSAAEEGQAGVAAREVEPIAELPIKILVDNHDPTPREVWEKRIRERIAVVSRILMEHCRLRLTVAAVETWDSGDEPQSFPQALQQFRRRVDPAPGRLAIGFTGRYPRETKRVDLGITHGMLQSHILIREWTASMHEPKRVEVLLHEIGHYLGAVHSPDAYSVMRPVLDDKNVIRREMPIAFDPVNTLLINLIADEIRARQADSITDLSPSSREQLTRIYEAMLRATPEDSSIRQYLSQVKMAGETPLTRATGYVVREVRRVAQAQGTAPPHAAALPTDALTERYVRHAALAAAQLPREVAAEAFLLGVGIALDDSAVLLSNPVTADFCRKVETAPEREERLRALGRPTLRGRRDWAQHFFLSAYLTAAVGPSAAESAGLAKELVDGRSRDDFSYRDLAANAAGIDFAQRLIDETVSLADVASGFSTADWMPDVGDLPEGVSWQEVRLQLSGRNDGSMRHYRDLIRGRTQGGKAAQP